MKKLAIMGALAIAAYFGTLYIMFREIVANREAR